MQSDINIWGKHDRLNSSAYEEKADQLFEKDKWERRVPEKFSPESHPEKTGGQGFRGLHGDLVIKSR